MMSLRVFGAFVSTVFIFSAAGCGGGPPMWGAPPGGGPAPGHAFAPTGSAENKCDPKGCHDFCSNMRCIENDFSGDKCVAVCQARCGDAFFEAQDAGVMACVLNVGPTLDCSPLQACCDEYLTNQICAQ